MSGWITPRECEERFPGWLAERAASGLGWALNGQPMLDPVTSRFGGVEVRVMLNPDGSPNHDKGVYIEAKNQNTVAFGRRGGQLLIGCTEEERAFADMPEGGPADPPMRFLQPVVMGFFEKVLGSDAKTFKERLESGDEASIREALEEMGVVEDGIKSLAPLGVMWPNATNTATVTLTSSRWRWTSTGSSKIRRAESGPSRTASGFPYGRSCSASETASTKASTAAWGRPTRPSLYGSAAIPRL